MNILLISKDNKSIKKISGIFSADRILTGHQLKIHEEPLDAISDTGDTQLFIIDISLYEENDEKLFNFLNSASGADLKKLLILEPGQTELLKKIYKYPIKINDFIFKQNLDSELAARTGNILFRDFKIKPANSIIIDEMVLDLDKYELLISGKKVELTFKEYELLKILLENKNKVFTRTQLLSAVWDYDYYGGSRTVDVHMRRLRSKMDPPYSDMLRTVRNVGYMFSPLE